MAIVGRPNVGKSTLFNRLIGDERSIVHDLPGTTRDTIDTVVETDAGPVRFIDTAGMRRKSRIGEGAEYYSLVRALQAIDRADVACLVIDATEGVTHQDQRLAERIDAAGSPVVIILNKWDLLAAEKRAEVVDQAADRLAFLGYAPTVKISALSGKGAHKLIPAIDESISAYHRRVPTRQLNLVIQAAQAAQPAPGGKILYITQGTTDPPTFVVFSTKALPAPYLRYLERKHPGAFRLRPHAAEVPRAAPGSLAGAVAFRRCWWSIPSFCWCRPGASWPPSSGEGRPDGSRSRGGASARAWRPTVRAARSRPSWPTAPTARSCTPPCCTRWRPPPRRRRRSPTPCWWGRRWRSASSRSPSRSCRGGSSSTRPGLIEEQARQEAKAAQVLDQKDLAPRHWAARLAPLDLPVFEGFEVGRAYEPGDGFMAGDFFDVVSIGPKRMAAVIGDVSGHGIESSITAFQVKYLLRVFLRQYRDPAQALEQLNAVISAQTGAEEFVSLFVAVFDQTAGTLRHASAGHPPAWMWHDGEVRPLRTTGPMLTLDPKASYFSREVLPRARRPADSLHRRAHRGPGRRHPLRRGADRPARAARPPGGGRRPVQEPAGRGP